MIIKESVLRDSRKKYTNFDFNVFCLFWESKVEFYVSFIFKQEKAKPARVQEVQKHSFEE